MNKSLSLVLPMYNEIGYVRETVSKAISALESFISDFEIIIVDDASNDGSEKIADSLSRGDARIRVIHHIGNRKLGGALKTGFYNATKDIIIYTDMDLPFDLSVLKDIYPLISEFDIITGYRKNGRESLLRAFYSKGYNLLINYIFRVNIKDVNFSLKMFRREILNDIELKSEGSFIDAEFLAKARKIGCSIRELGVDFRPRVHGASRLSTPAVIFKIIFEMIKFYPEIKSFSRGKRAYNKLKALYKGAGFKEKVYNFIRFKTCPFLSIAESIPSEGGVVDLGCGTGLFLNTIRLNSGNQALLGFDKDRRKIDTAIKSLNGNRNIRFELGHIDSADFNIPKTRCVVLIDTLYYLDRGQKRDLLKRCFRALESNGTIIIKDINKELSLKFIWTFLQEFLAVKVFRITSSKGLYFGNKREYCSLLNEAGFIAEARDLTKKYFYPHILYVGKKT